MNGCRGKSVSHLHSKSKHLMFQQEYIEQHTLQGTLTAFYSCNHSRTQQIKCKIMRSHEKRAEKLCSWNDIVDLEN